MDNKDFFLVCGSILTVMLCLGLVGNVISFVTWRAGKRCKNLPGAVYLSALAVSDNLALGTAGIKYAIQLLFGLNLWDVNIVACTLFHTTWHLFFLISTWIVVSLTIERTLAITQPFKTTVRTSKRTELIVVGVLSFVSLLINLPFTFGAQMMPASGNAAGKASVNTSVISNTSTHEPEHANGNSSSVMNGPVEMICQADPDSFYYKYENEFHNWFIDFGLLFSVPVSILTVCNMIILVTLCRRRFNAAVKESQKKEGLSGAMTMRVLILSLVQCVSVGPFSVAALIPGVLPEVKAVDTVFIDQLLTILVLVWYLNNCVNFILYSLFGKAFRHDCYDLLKAMFTCRQSHLSSITLSHAKMDSKSSKLALIAESSASSSASSYSASNSSASETK